MTPIIAHNFPFFEAFSTAESGWDTWPFASNNQLSINLPQLFGEMEYSSLDNLDSPGADVFWDYNGLLAAPVEQSPTDSDTQDRRSIFTPFPRQLTTDLVDGKYDWQDITLGVSMEKTSNYSDSTDVSNQLSLTPPDSAQSAPTPELPVTKTTMRPPRRQNHSCDQCRSAKRACDLSEDAVIRKQKPSKACSMCGLRGVECTVTWLSNKHSEQRAKKRPRLAPPSRGASSSADLITYTQAAGPLLDTSILAPTLGANLARDIESQETCSQHFHLYVDVFDIPLSHCLLPGSMPPGYSLGLAALSPIGDSSNLSNYLSKANSWIKSCWNTSFKVWGSTVAAPRIFHTVSILDALFQRSGAQPHGPSRTSRDLAITETYKWAAIALSAQFVTGNEEQRDINKAGPYGHLRYSHDLALAAWETAKQKVFGNIGATTSFRVALSLLLLGHTPPPGPTDRSTELAEDAEYALCEGIRRLHRLCAQARARLLANQEGSVSQPLTNTGTTPMNNPNFPRLSVEENKYILELIGAVEWLISIFNAGAIAGSCGKTRPLCPEIPHQTMGRSSPMNDVTSRPGDDTSWTLPLHGHRMRHSVLAPTEPEVATLTVLWHQGTPTETLLQSLRQAAYSSITLWRSVAELTLALEDIQWNQTNYDGIFQHFKKTIFLVRAWRSAFGVLDSSLRACLEQASCELWRMVAFTSNDTDLAILVFCDLAQKFEIRLAQQPCTPKRDALRDALRRTSGFRKMQRLISAEQVCMVASTCQRTSRSGFQSSSGLKSRILDIAAHPNPGMMVQLHTLAARVLMGELHSSVSQLEGKRVSELTASIDICRQTLEGLRETLVTFPDVARFDDPVLAL